MPRIPATLSLLLSLITFILCGCSASVPLNTYIRRGDLDRVKIVTKGAVRLDAWDKRGQAALHVAAMNNQSVIARLLIIKGASVDRLTRRFGATPLHIAAASNSVDAARVLLEEGATIDARDSIGRTPLHLAAARGSFDTASLLIEKGADVNAKAKEDSKTPLHLAAEQARQQVARLLLKNGAEVDALTKAERLTPLHLAAARGYYDFVKLLILNGADVRARDFEGHTPLYYAEWNVHKKVAELLRSYNAR